nr:S-layer family protein [Gloeocapsopsis dulcis]
MGSESSIVTPEVDSNTSPVYQIDGGAVRGTNLFHSFEQFSLPTGSAAYFNNALEIDNIISRVTGSSISNIDGLIQANGTANLFLLNPNGITFGSGARLSLGGSFLGSTASSLNFADGTQFRTSIQSDASLLTVSVPIGLQFGTTAGEIRVQGSGAILDPNTGLLSNKDAGLSVRPNATLGLIGSNLKLEGSILGTNGGRIELGSVADEGTVSLKPIAKGWGLGYENISSFGNIQLSDAAAVDANGAGGGDIHIRGNTIRIIDGSQIEASTLGAQPGGTLEIYATESVEVIGMSGMFALVYETATGAGGSIEIETGKLVLQDVAQISTATYGEGSAGSLTVKASESVELSGSLVISSEEVYGSGLTTNVLPGATGFGGDLFVETKQLFIQDGAQIGSFVDGFSSGGKVEVRASELVELSGTPVENSKFPSGIFTSVQEGAFGNANNIYIETKQLTIRDGAALSTATYGSGAGGNLTVKATVVEVIGRSQDDQAPSWITAQVFEESTGKAGNVTIETRNLVVRDGAEVAVSSLNSTPDAQGAGNLQVAAQTIYLDDQGKIIANTASGQGGNINLNVQDLFLRRTSEISTTAGIAGSGGDGGDISINNARFIIAAPNENNDIKANAFLGQGGRVAIDAQNIFGLTVRSLQDLQTLLGTSDPAQLDPVRLLSSDITAISQTNPQLSGEVVINTPDVDPSRGAVVLPQNLVDVSGLIAQGCAAGNVANESQFVVTGRGGLPPNPGEVLSSDDVWQDWRSSSVTTINAPEAAIAPSPRTTSTPLIEATNWATNNQGEVMLIAATSTNAVNPGQSVISCR